MALQAREVVVNYPGRRALDGVTCTLTPGRVTAFIGPNGAGKSSLLRVLSGVLRPDRGQVVLQDRPVAEWSPRERARRVALVAQQPSVAFDFDARRVVSFGAEGTGRGAAAVDRAIDRFGLADLGTIPFGALSVGQRQRVSLARAWAQLDGPDAVCLLADEPLAPMDPAHARVALNAIRELADRGLAVGIVVHDLTTAARFADDAVLLNRQGRLEGFGPVQSVLTAARLTALFASPLELLETVSGPVVLPGR